MHQSLKAATAHGKRATTADISLLISVRAMEPETALCCWEQELKEGGRCREVTFFLWLTLQLPISAQAGGRGRRGGRKGVSVGETE